MNMRVKDFDIEYWRDEDGKIKELKIYRHNSAILEWNKMNSITDLNTILDVEVPFFAKEIKGALAKAPIEVEFSDTYKKKLVKIRDILETKEEPEKKLAAIEALAKVRN